MPETLLLGRVCDLHCEYFIFGMTSNSFQTYVITGALVEAPYSKSGQPPPGTQLRFVGATKFTLDPNTSASVSIKTFQDLEV